MLLKEGGNVFKNPDKSLATKRIDRVDVETTLAWLEKITGLPHNDFKLGSTGVADTSGDLDVAVNIDDVSKDEMVQKLSAWCKQNGKNPKEWIAKSGINVHFKTPINGDESLGFVQTDLMFGNPEWLKWSMRGEPGGSQYKGKHRHLLLASIAKAQGMKWSYLRGLIDRATDDVISDQPDEIAKMLLGKNNDAKSLETVTSIYDAIRGRSDLEQITADARTAFERDRLTLPEGTEIRRIRELAGI
jgi:hypothetical protein